MSEQPAAGMLWLLEVASLRVEVTAAHLRARLGELRLPLRIVGELTGYPALVVESAELNAAQLHDRLPSDLAVEVVALRRHFRPERLRRGQLAELVAEGRHARKLAVGAAAVERAMQRRRLELLVVASGVAEAYAKMLHAIVERNGYDGALVQSGLTREELGHAAGVRRAGCVGLLRGRRHVSVEAGQVDHQGCAVSSLPGSPSSASATPQQPPRP